MGNILIQNPLVEVTKGVPFTFSSGTVTIQSVFSGNIISSAWVIIDVAFNSISSSITFGTASMPNLVLGGSDVTPTIVGQYSNYSIVSITTNESLELFITSGGATVGSGTLFYRYRS